MNGMKGVVSGKLNSFKSLIPRLATRDDVGANEVDVEFRLHLSEKVLKGMDRMGEIKKEYSEEGKVVILGLMDKSMQRLSRIGEQLKSNKSGHSTTGRASLDSLYDYDMTLLEEVDKLDLMVEGIGTSDGYEAKVREEIKKLDHFLTEIEELLSKRNELLENP